jgi:hypothetical protein
MTALDTIQVVDTQHGNEVKYKESMILDFCL